MCTEYPLNDIASIRAIRAEELPLRPSDLMAHTIKASNYALESRQRSSDILMIAIDDYEDTDRYSTDENGDAVPTTGWMVPLAVGSRGSIKEEEEDATAGRSHMVTLKADIYDNTPNIRTALRKLERLPHTLLVTFRDMRRALVAADPYAYRCMTNRESSTSIELTLHTHVGLQWVE